MCVGDLFGGKPKVPKPIKYAAVKTPTGAVTGGANAGAGTIVTSARNQLTGPSGLLTDPNIRRPRALSGY